MFDVEFAVNKCVPAVTISRLVVAVGADVETLVRSSGDIKTGDVKVLFVSVSVPAIDAMLASVIAVLMLHCLPK